MSKKSNLIFTRVLLVIIIVVILLVATIVINKGLNHAPSNSELSGRIQSNLESALHVKVKDIQIYSTASDDVLRVKADNDYVYTTKDGNFIINGQVLDMRGGQLQEISAKSKTKDNLERLKTLTAQDYISYPSTSGETKSILYVFTDSSCPYCRKFHETIPALNKSGIEVRYLAWPRGEVFFPEMNSIWCSDDKKEAFRLATSDVVLQPKTCENSVIKDYNLGKSMGVNGTPSIFSSDGRFLGGYMTPTEISETLKIN